MSMYPGWTGDDSYWAGAGTATAQAASNSSATSASSTASTAAAAAAANNLKVCVCAGHDWDFEILKMISDFAGTELSMVLDNSWSNNDWCEKIQFT